MISPYYKPQRATEFRGSTNPDEDWTKISDLSERRRIHNRIAQRNYRKKLKRRLQELERRAAASRSVSPNADGESAEPNLDHSHYAPVYRTYFSAPYYSPVAQNEMYTSNSQYLYESSPPTLCSVPSSVSSSSSERSYLPSLLPERKPTPMVYEEDASRLAFRPSDPNTDPSYFTSQYYHNGQHQQVVSEVKR